ncbi:MAG: hypothetical protein E6Q69_01340 [Aquipseudomonas alcaligenes]|uniref:Uncharacterized protein n=1 Tax=Aquipseudomonas alcaligenes TaxID=43263 RepID=A0A5C7WG70_AQUAC|nr:MAG: hypothetical protein E6Q69_01340 [Pseudomonas alcaligenes]
METLGADSYFAPWMGFNMLQSTWYATRLRAKQHVRLGMPDKKLAVHLFEVDESRANQPFEVALDTLHNLPLEDRIYPVQGQEMRLEHAQPPTAANPFWLLDFGKFRDYGPGQASRDTRIRDIQLDANHTFAEDTAALFCRGQNGQGWLLLQYNHVGTRPTAIESYISGVLRDPAYTYELAVKLTGDAFARLDSATHFTKLKLKVASASLTPELLEGGMSIRDALQAALPMNGDYISIEISTRKRAAEAGIRIQPMADFLKRLVTSGAAESATVKGSDGHHTPEAIDLLQGKLTQRFNVRNQPGTRITQQQRWDALVRTYNSWGRYINP